jgi:putative membrane protein
MRRHLLPIAIAIATAAFAGPATFAQTAPTMPMPGQSPTDTYVQKASASDQFEIQSGGIASQKATNADVKTFAQMMVADHTKSSEKIAAAAKSDGATSVSAALDPAHDEQLQSLQKMSGPEFDRLYMDMQVKGHTEALQLHRSYSESGDDAKLKAVATEIVPVVSHHLDEAKRIAAALQ